MHSKTLAIGLTAAVAVLNGLALTAYAGNPETENTTAQVTIEGRAAIYSAWSCKGNAAVETTPGEAPVPVPGHPGGVRSTLATVTVKDIDRGDGTMNNHMRKALRGKYNPGFCA
jgi:hypothetical protein